MSMKRITIERYKTPVDGYAGLIEGETDDGRKWIMYLGLDGTPELFWPNRDEDGGVTGDGFNLKDAWGIVRRYLKVENAEPGGPEDMIATFPVFEDGMRGIIFAVSPSDHPRANTQTRMMSFIARMDRAFSQQGPGWEDGWEISDDDREAARWKSADEAAQSSD